MKNEVAVFGGGCFWCTEAVFKMLKGVSSVLPGYTGGTTPNPTYEQVCTGDTGHVESVQVEFDPSQVRYEDLLTVFFGSHDPTTKNRQGNDVGTQYRSAIFYTTLEQKHIAEKFISDINSPEQSGGNESSEALATTGAPIVTDLEALDVFYVAENYHQDYFARNKSAPYCELVINPKLEKVTQKFAALLKSNVKS